MWWWSSSAGAAGPLNYNVKLALWWALWENCSSSVRSGDVLSALLFLMTGSNTTVGLVQGLNGIAQLAAAMPAGYLADRHRRDTLLRAGALVGAAAGSLLAAALAWRPTVSMLAAASMLLGCYSGTYNAALEALFADSVPPGRSSPYSRKYAVTVLASSFGPWLSLLLFRRLGNKWDAADCRAVLLWGVALMALPLTLMLCFDDDRALKQPGLPHGAAGLGRRVQQQQQQAWPTGGSGRSSSAAAAAAASSGYEALPAEPPRDVEAVAADDALSAAAAAVAPPTAQAPLAAAPSAGSLVSLVDEGSAFAAAAAGQDPGCGCVGCGPCSALPAGVAVTLLITGSDLIGALASGMTLKFFALFFIQAVHLSPMAVSLVGALSPLGVAAAALACQPLSKPLGRVQISLVTRSLDIALLVLLAYLPTAPPSMRPVLVAVHLARMAVANATRPLMRSVLMDWVPRHLRGRVSAVDSVRSFSWSGSAALGGFLIQRYGFQRTFLITAAVKAAAFVPLVALLAYVPDGVCLPPGARAARLAQQQRQLQGGPAGSEQPAQQNSSGQHSMHCSAPADRQQAGDERQAEALARQHG